MAIDFTGKLVILLGPRVALSLPKLESVDATEAFVRDHVEAVAKDRSAFLDKGHPVYEYRVPPDLSYVVHVEARDANKDHVKQLVMNARFLGITLVLRADTWLDLPPIVRAQVDHVVLSHGMREHPQLPLPVYDFTRPETRCSWLKLE